MARKRTMSPPVSSSSSGTSHFKFVMGGIQSEARSHAMKEHWKRRNQHKEANKHIRKRSSRTLLPRSTSSSSGVQQDEDSDVVENQEENQGIPAQLLCGTSCALSSSRPDPFQTCPVHLTSQHQKLLHHCTYEDSRHRCLWKFLLTGLQGLALMRL